MTRLNLLLPAALLASIAAFLLPAPAVAAAKPCVTRGLGGPAWVAVSTANVRVWALRSRAADVAAARRLAPVAQRVHGRFRGLLGRTPPSDGGVACPHGGDRRLDVYVSPSGRDGRGRKLPRGIAAAYRPYGVDPCDPLRPGIIVARPGLSRWILAHELYHAFASAFPRARDCVFYSDWDEAHATWAGDLAFPRDDEEHVHASVLSKPGLPLGVISGYAAWVFPYALAKWHGPSVIRTLELQMGTKKEDEHLDPAIPGGLRKAWARFGLAGWNQAPIPATAGGKSFAGWDRFKVAPKAAEFELADRPVDGRADALPGGKLTTLARSYTHLTVAADVRGFRLQFAPGTTGTVGAYVKLATGAWTEYDWTDKTSVSFCRRLPDENVVEVVLVLGNSAIAPPAIDLKPEVVLTNGCWPATIAGTFSGRTSGGGIALTWNGTISYAHEPLDPLRKTPWVDSVHYVGTAGTLTWDATTAPGTTCSYSGSGSVAPDRFPVGHSTANIEFVRSATDGGWPYRVDANVPAGGLAAPPVMPVTETCPMLAPIVVDAASLLSVGGAAVYNGYSTGNPIANRITADLLTFAGNSTNTSTGTQQWIWSFTGAGRVDQ